MGNPRGVKRDFEALERRRLEGSRLLEQGLNQSKWLGVSKSAVKA